MSDEQQNPPNEDEQHSGAYDFLRKMQQHLRANMPFLAQRTMSNFTLQREPQPEEATSSVYVVVYPQNPFVGEPEVRTMMAKDIQPGLVNARVQVVDSRGIIAQPDEDGNYYYWPGTPEFDQVNAFYYTTFTLRMFERYAKRTIPWAFLKPRLTIDPHVGKLANAFYNEQEEMLGFHTFTDDGQPGFSMAQSADVVTHEAAHAVLDGLRDLFNESFGLGPRAFHESFGDITAMLVALHDDVLVRELLHWTEGDLRKSNFVTEVAEHATQEMLNSDYFSQHTVYLRNAFNTLKLLPFDSLEYVLMDPMERLSRQEHNYSRVFTGAAYDILVGVYEAFKGNGVPDFVALYRARDVLGHLLMMAIEAGPMGEFDFADMARSFLTADAILCDGKHETILTEIFAERNILSVEDSAEHLGRRALLPDLRLPDVLNHQVAAAQFLENQVIPALKLENANDLVPVGAYRNADGYAFLTYSSTKIMRLNGESYVRFGGEVEVFLFGGLTLVFDPDGKLCSATMRPVTEEDERQIGIIVAELVQHNRIANQLFPPEAAPDPSPKGLYVPNQFFGSGAKIIKYPVIYDEVHDPELGSANFWKLANE
jgi:hypothetical protein